MVTVALPTSLSGTNSIAVFSARLPIRLVRSQPEIVSRAVAGDTEAFTEIYHLHKKRVFNICLRMVREFSLAEELAQDTFIQLHRKIGSFRGDSAFTTWLHRITVNIVLMHLRKAVLPVVSLEDLMTEVGEDRLSRQFGSRDLAQAGVIDRLALKGALDALAPGYRSIFLLHEVEGFDHMEIAEMQQCSLGNSKSQLHKARRALRLALSNELTSTTSAVEKENAPLRRVRQA